MFKPLEMHYISLKILTEDTPLVAQILAKFGLFHPDVIEQTENRLEPTGETLRSTFHNAVSRLNKILACIPHFEPPMAMPSTDFNVTELQRTDQQLADLWQQFSALDEQKYRLQEQKNQSRQLLDTLKKFEALDIDLNLLHSPRQFINLYIGTIPENHLAHLTNTMPLAEHLIRPFHKDESLVYVVVMGSLQFAKEVSSVLEHAEFHPLAIPPEFCKSPKEVHDDLSKKLTQLETQLVHIEGKKKDIVQDHYEFIVSAYNLLNNTFSYSELTNTLRTRGRLTVIEGWIPTMEMPHLEQTLQEQLPNPFVLDARKPLPSEHPQVPSLIRHRPLLASFAALVKNYGIPRYGEFDPTVLFAVSFLLMFGAMFGDVGHGAVITTLGWYFRKKLNHFKVFFISAGIFSTLFGFLYGSIFGFHSLPALGIQPLSDPTLMLKIALYWGMGFILLATFITVSNRWREGHYTAALFDTAGIAGISLYLGGFYAIKHWMETGAFALEQQLALFVPLSILMIYKWLEHESPLGERLIVTAVEGFEAIISYLANTLSFLRVAAFSLNHVALAFAVFTVANLMSSTITHWITVIIGNLFIIGFEGAIVIIQILRLEYYEGFSRFFSGDGRDFSPLSKGLNR